MLWLEVLIGRMQWRAPDAYEIYAIVLNIARELEANVDWVAGNPHAPSPLDYMRDESEFKVHRNTIFFVTPREKGVLPFTVFINDVFDELRGTRRANLFIAFGLMSNLYDVMRYNVLSLQCAPHNLAKSLRDAARYIVETVREISTQKGFTPKLPVRIFDEIGNQFAQHLARTYPTLFPRPLSVTTRVIASVEGSKATARHKNYKLEFADNIHTINYIATINIKHYEPPLPFLTVYIRLQAAKPSADATGRAGYFDILDLHLLVGNEDIQQATVWYSWRGVDIYSIISVGGHTFHDASSLRDFILREIKDEFAQHIARDYAPQAPHTMGYLDSIESALPQFIARTVYYTFCEALRVALTARGIGKVIFKPYKSRGEVTGDTVMISFNIDCAQQDYYERQLLITGNARYPARLFSVIVGVEVVRRAPGRRFIEVREVQVMFRRQGKGDSGDTLLMDTPVRIRNREEMLQLGREVSERVFSALSNWLVDVVNDVANAQP